MIFYDRQNLQMKFDKIRNALSGDKGINTEKFVQLSSCLAKYKFIKFIWWY